MNTDWEYGQGRVTNTDGLEIVTYAHDGYYYTVAMRGQRLLCRRIASNRVDAENNHNWAVLRYRNVILPEERYLVLSVRALLDAGLLLEAGKELAISPNLVNLWNRVLDGLKDEVTTGVELEVTEEEGVSFA